MKRLALAVTLGLLGVLLAIAPASAQYGGNPPHTPPGPPAGCPVKGGPPPKTPPCHPHGKVVGTPSASAPGQAKPKKAELEMSTAASTTQDDLSLQVTIGAALLLAGTGSVLLRRTRSRFTIK